MQQPRATLLNKILFSMGKAQSLVANGCLPPAPPLFPLPQRYAARDQGACGGPLLVFSSSPWLLLFICSLALPRRGGAESRGPAGTPQSPSPCPGCPGGPQQGRAAGSSPWQERALLGGAGGGTEEQRNAAYLR